MIKAVAHRKYYFCIEILLVHAFAVMLVSCKAIDPIIAFFLEFFGWNTWNFIPHFLLRFEDVEINVNILLFAVKHELFFSLFSFSFFPFLERHNVFKRKVKGKHFYLLYERFKYDKKYLSVYHCVCVCRPGKKFLYQPQFTNSWR